MHGMTGLLSSISSKFSTSLILGALLPTAVYTLLSIVLLIPLFPAGWSPMQIANAIETLWIVLAVTGITILLSGVLFNLNIPIVRFYEGYPWRDSYLGKRRSEYYRMQFATLTNLHQGLRTLIISMEKTGKCPSELPAIRLYWDRLGRRLNSELPKREAAILPTRLGNVIASFEDYSYEQYGIDSITIWPRLAAKIDPPYAAAIEDSKTSFDFMLNSSLLSIILAFALLLVGLTYFIPMVSRWSFTIWVGEIITICWLAYLSYLGAINRAMAWGTTVKAAFDLYRWELLKQLGYTSLPATMEDERRLWKIISQQIIYGDQPLLRLAHYDRSQVGVHSYPPAQSLNITRSVHHESAERLRIFLRVMNNDLKLPAPQVIIIDSVPAGYDYHRGSARDENTKQSIFVEGANPYTFLVEDISAGEEVTISYAIDLRKTS
jgi:hypothetical protein